MSNIKFISKNSYFVGTYATSGSVGIDVNSFQNYTLRAHEIAKISTGISIEMPSGMECQVRSRSGMASKGIIVLGGTIDSDYRGEIIVLLHNLSSEDFQVEIGMRIAQMVFNRVEIVSMERVDGLSETTRGAGGFGSTGVNPTNK